MRNFFKEHILYFVLILIGLLWILGLNYFLQMFNQNYVYPDTESYINASKELYFSFKPNEIRPVLIAALTGLPLLFGFSENVLFNWNIFLNLLLWFSTLLLIFKSCSNYTSKKTAFYIALLYLFSFGSLLIVFEFLSETIFAFFLILIVVLLQKYEKTERISYYIFALSLVVLSVLIKPISLGLFFIIVLFYGYKRIKMGLFSKYSFVLYLSVFLLLGHLFAMKKTYGNFTVSYIDTFTYYNYLGTRADCLKNNTEFKQCNNERYRYFNSLSRQDGKIEAYNDIKNQLINNTQNFIIAYWINLKYNSNTGSGYFYAYQNIKKDSNFEKYKVFFRGISRLQTIFYSIVGILLAVYFLIQRKSELYLKIIAFTVLYIIGISAISSDQADRFHIVVYPLILILLARICTFKKDVIPNVAPLQK